MPRQLDDPDLSGVARTADEKAPIFQHPVVLRIHAVLAVVVFGHLGAAVERCRQRAGANDYTLLLSDERALERRDDESVRVGAAFSMVGVSEPEDVARELDDRVLEAASGADERNPALARVANRGQRALHAAVRARR